MSPPPAKAALKPPPQYVRWFERVFYAAIALSFVRIAMEWIGGTNLLIFAANYALAMVQIWLVWMAARRRKAWARWWLLVFFVAGSAFSLIQGSIAGPSDASTRVIRGLQLLLENIALVLTFTVSARRWFNPERFRAFPE